MPHRNPPRAPHRPTLLEGLEPRRLFSAGLPDTTFGASGSVVDNTVGGAQRVAIQSDDKLVTVQSLNGNFEVERFTADGKPDTTFGSIGRVSTDFGGTDVPHAVAIQANGKIVVAGESNGNFAVARYNTDGSLDTTFGTAGRATADFGLTEQGTAVAIQADGKIVVAGNRSVPQQNISELAIVRFTVGGILDSTAFGKRGLVSSPQTAASAYAIHDVAIQSDGRIVVVGTNSSGGSAFVVQRYTAAGANDGTVFAVPTISGGQVFNAVRVQTDGRIVAAGQAAAEAAVVRFNTDGTRDGTFGAGGVFHQIVGSGAAQSRLLDEAIQPNGQVVLSGAAASTPGGASDFLVARLTAAGQLDTSFGTVAGSTRTDFGADEQANGVVIESSGRIVAAGGSATSLELAAYTNDSSGAPDTTPPTATLASAPRLRTAQKSDSFVITYHDNVAVNAATLDSANVRVVGPNGFDAPAQLLLVQRGGHASTTIATYAVRGPGGGWDSADNGLYTIQLQANQVSDTSGNFIAAEDVGQFTVRIAGPGGTIASAFQSKRKISDLLA